VKKVPLLPLLASFLLTACTLVPRPTQERNLTTPIPITAASEDVVPCAPENWELAITSIEQTNLGDGTISVFARIGIENNDSLWGKVIGPVVSDEKAAQETVFLTTKDGSTYEYLNGSNPIPTLYETTGQIETPLLPPKFVTLGKTIDGHPLYYNFAFQIPSSKIPETVTIGGLAVDCIQPHIIGENGKPAYRHKSILLPSRTYNLETDVSDIHDEPSARRYPNLVGAELVTPDWKETIFITDVARNGDSVVVTFDFTNFSSHAVSPSFNGYLIGSGRVFICQIDCENQPNYDPVQPGHIAQDLTWTFTVPEDETNLMFVYTYGGKVDLNEVYRVNIEESI
jgi:hypothetical protein